LTIRVLLQGQFLFGPRTENSADLGAIYRALAWRWEYSCSTATNAVAPMAAQRTGALSLIWGNWST